LLKIGGKEVPRGQRARIEIPVGRMPSAAMVDLPVRVVHGAGEGPKIWLSAAIHGDEINGVEIIRRVLHKLDPATLQGSVVAAPIVNVFGFSTHSRYLPDRRDLNRSFPGSKKGSLAARLARIFMSEIVDQCTHGIDLHTAAAGRINLPHIRADLEDPETRRCAEAFAAPVMMSSSGPGGSLRRAAKRRGKVVLVYEAGEVLRYNRHAIEVGTDGVWSVLAALGMVESQANAPAFASVESHRQKWVRAQRGGIVHIQRELGERVVRRQPLAVICDPIDEQESVVRSPGDGYIIGGITNPLVNRGDALLHIAFVEPPGDVHAESPRPLDAAGFSTDIMKLPAGNEGELAGLGGVDESEEEK